MTNLKNCTLSTSAIILTHDTLDGVVANVKEMKKKSGELVWLGSIAQALFKELDKHSDGELFLTGPQCVKIAETLRDVLKFSLGKRAGLKNDFPAFNIKNAVNMWKRFV